uniref:Uncharacterized protein n=1 Tax=Oryza glumipatula TaxID=40148 RepID=A0A0D9YCM1_9ORYZ
MAPTSTSPTRPTPAPPSRLPPKALSAAAAGSFTRQIHVTRQEAQLCAAASFDRDSTNAFQLYVAESLAFTTKSAGFLYGRVDADTKEVGTEDVVQLMRTRRRRPALTPSPRASGCAASAWKTSNTGEYTMSNREVLQATELQAEGGIPDWVTAIVKLEVGDVGYGDVHFEAFQMSGICVKLFKYGVLQTEIGDKDDPRLCKMRKEVVAGGKDTMEVDNDFFLVSVKISDHQDTFKKHFLGKKSTTP